MANSTAISSKSIARGKEPPFSHEILSFQELEANSVFPSDTKSAYKSSGFTDSYKFPYNPDPLASGNRYDIYDEMRHDEQIKAAISFKKDLCLAPGWEIKCEKEDIAKVIEQNLNEKIENSFEDCLRDILSAFDYGFSLSEPVYRKVGGTIELKNIVTRPPHDFQFHLDDKGDVTKIVQEASEGPLEFKPDYFLHHVYQPSFGNPFGQSDLRSAHTPWKMKKFTMRFWAIYLERFAGPTVHGKYPEGWGPAEVSNFLNKLKTIQNTTTLATPEGTEIELLMSQKDSAGIYQGALNMMNVMIARSLLVPDLMGLSGDKTEGGSYALGKTQFQLFMDLLKKEQKAVARKLTLKIIRPMVLANHGDVPCQFVFKEMSTEDNIEYLRLWKDAVSSNVWVPEDDEINHFRESIRFPTGLVTRPAEPEPGIDPVTGEPIPNDGKTPAKKAGTDNEPDNEGARGAARKLSANGKDVHFRVLSELESKLDFSAIRLALDRSEFGAIGVLQTTGTDIWTDFVQQIKDRKVIENFRPELINEIKPRKQKDMNAAVKSFMKDGFRNAFNMAQREFFKVHESKFAMTEELLPADLLAIITAESFKLVGDYTVNITGKMRNELVQGIKQGLNERDIVDRLMELGAEESERWLKTVVRTKASEMFNRGRKSYWDNDPIASQVVEAFALSAILDDRTTDVCRYVDGKIFEKGELTSQLCPPFHFGCRTVVVPVTRYEDYRSSGNYYPVGNQPTIDQLKAMGAGLLV